MIQIKKIVLACVLIQMAISCQCNRDSFNYGNPLNTIRFNIKSDIKVDADLISLIDTIEFVKLETNEDFAIGHISKLIYDQQHIYILDPVSVALYKFSYKGEGIEKISNVGRGPGEFLRPTDFLIIDDEIIILDGYSSKIICFDKHGNFKREYSSGTTAELFGYVGDNHIAMFYGNRTSLLSKNNIQIINSSGEAEAQFMHIPSFIRNKSLSLQKATDYLFEELLYTNPYSYNIYSVTRDTFAIKYLFDFGRYGYSEDYMKNNRRLNASEFNHLLNQEEYVHSIDYYNETLNLMGFWFIYNSEVHEAYYNKNSGEASIFSRSDYPVWLKIVKPAHIFSGDNFMVSAINSFALSSLTEADIIEMSRHNLFSELPVILDDINLEDNPVLVFYRYK